MLSADEEPRTALPIKGDGCVGNAAYADRGFLRLGRNLVQSGLKAEFNSNSTQICELTPCLGWLATRTWDN